MIELLTALLLGQAAGFGKCPPGQVVQSIPRNAPPVCVVAGGGSGAPTTVPYWTGAADAALSAEHNLGALGTGLVLNTAGTPSAYTGATCTTPNLLQTLTASGAPGCYQLKLDELANPGADKTFTMANKVLVFAYQAPVAGTGGAFEIEAVGGFSGDLLHLHQHTGNPGAGTDLMHAEWSDTDVTGLRLTGPSAGATAATITGVVTASAFSGPLTGAVTGNASTASALAADGADCVGAGEFAKGTTAAGVASGCAVPPGTYVLPDAAAGVTGGMRLTGDLGGSATSPSVVDDSHAHGASTISGLDVGDITTGTLPQARGGMGAASLTCAGTDKVTCNGTTCTCSTDLTGGGVDLSASEFVTFAANANLSAERVLTAGTNTAVDTGTAGQVKINVSGLEPAGTYSGVGACGANTWASTLNDTAAPTCTQPAFSNLSGSATTGQLPTITVAKGGTNLTTIAANQVWVGTAADTVAVKTLPSCSNATTSKLLFDNATQTFSCGTDQTSAGGGGVGTLTRLTATWASSAVANTLGIVGAGGVPMTSPTYAAGAPYSGSCRILMTRPSITNQPRYGIQSSGTVTTANIYAVIGLAGTLPARTEALQSTNALATAGCAAGCTANVITGGAARVFVDTIEIAGVMNATGTISLVMAPSAAAAHTAQIGSYCVWY